MSIPSPNPAFPGSMSPAIPGSMTVNPNPQTTSVAVPPAGTPTLVPPATEVPRHPAVMAILRHFEYSHLPPHLAEISREAHTLAHSMASQLKDDPELTAGLRWLLLAKDSFVRAAIASAEAQVAP